MKKNVSARQSGKSHKKKWNDSEAYRGEVRRGLESK